MLEALLELPAVDQAGQGIVAREIDHLALHAAELGDVLEHQDAAGDAALAVLDGRHGVADGELPAVAPHQHGVASVLDDPALGQAALDGVGHRLAGALVDDVEDPRHRLAAGLGGVQPVSRSATGLR